MRSLLITGVAIAFASFGLGSTPTSAAQICEKELGWQLVEPHGSVIGATWQAVKSIYPLMKEFVFSGPDMFLPANKPRERPLSRPVTEEDAYWVTVAHGTSRIIDCTEEVSAGLYYPMGLMVKIHRIFDFTHYGNDRLRHLGTLALATSEYGLEVLIPIEHLAPVKPGDLYVFADSFGTIPICINARNDPRWRDCDPNDPPNRAVDPAIGVNAASRYNHLVSEEIESDMVARFKSASPTPDACSVLGGMQHYASRTVPRRHSEFVSRYGGRVDSSVQYESVEIGLCSSDEDNILHWKPLKLVTYATATRRLNLPWTTYYHRNAANLGVIWSTLMRMDFAPPAKVTCDDVHTMEKSKEGGLGVASETPYKLLAVSAHINLRTRMSTGITIGEDLSYDLGAYLFREALNEEPAETLLELALRDAWVTFDCSAGSRTNVRNMFVFHPGVSNSHIDVAVGDLYARVISSLKLSGGVYGEPSERRFRNLLNGSGAVWDIKDPAEYFYWRDVTKAYLWESSVPVRSVAIRTGKRDEILDHFAHLILAVLTTSDIGV